MGKTLTSFTSTVQEQHNQPLPPDLQYLLGMHTESQRKEAEQAMSALNRLDTRVRNAVIAAARKQKSESAIEDAVRKYNDDLASAYYRQARDEQQA